jgi:hypothetical protein
VIALCDLEVNMIENMMIVPVRTRRGETVEDVIKKNDNNKNLRDIVVRVRYDKDSNSDLLWVYILGLRNRRCDIIDVPYSI